LATGLTSKARSYLAEIVGDENITDDMVDLVAYSRDSSPEPTRLPIAIVRPGNAEEIAKIFRVANELKFPIIPRGGGTCAGGGGVSIRGDGVILDLGRLNRIIEISEQDMTVTANSAVTWGQLDYELSLKSYRPPFWGPESAFGATLGGSISCASMSSQGSTVAGSAADEVITLQVVLPNGDIIYTGSDSLPKAGKFARICNGGDYTGIFTGSLGVFGVITEATIKIEPLPKEARYAACIFTEWNGGIQYALKMLHYKIPEVLSISPGPRTVKSSYGVDGQCAFKYVIEEQDPTIADRKLELGKKFAQDLRGAIVADGDEKTRIWWKDMFMRLVTDARKRESFVAHGCHRVPLKKLPIAAEDAENYFFKECRVEELGMTTTLGSYVSDMRPTCSMYPMLFFKDDPETRKKAWEIWNGWMERAITSYGASPYWMGYAWARHLIPKLRSENYRMLVTLKKALDPNNILNPGLLLLD